ncbi:extracellular catalytic domain type 1 short-chain-length polyhydroxyalkanoate depolymerase [Urbifossiella limnaea]|uniref:Alpha/beta hydrolase family protein n=1 Tax=Urbifossiella limnaea TaxID=2528023 RepID=A0A517XXV7_9BACT|nr:PHB depolymerase family esterase [Urbifossiella limnaea]QDU22337.1 Alpha/beta hydrolase family protein [Urbifossiella limnaea]
MRHAALLVLLLAAAAPADTPAAPVPVAARKVKSGGKERTYLVHVPKGLDAKTPAPVVVVFHGAGMTARIMRAVTGLDAVADKHRFVVAYPDGTGLIPTWNSGGIPFVVNKTDDVVFARDLLDDLKAVAAVDPKRVYAAGFSNGGMMTYKLANEQADAFAAVCAVGGTMTYEEPAPKRPVPVLHFHGTDDAFVPMTGTPRTGKGPAFKSVEATAAAWAKANGCAAAPVEAELPDADPDDGCKVKRKTFAGGTGGAEVVVYTVEGGGHNWFGRPSLGGLTGRSTTDVDVNGRMWEFFQKHARP